MQAAITAVVPVAVQAAHRAASPASRELLVVVVVALMVTLLRLLVARVARALVGRRLAIVQQPGLAAVVAARAGETLAVWPLVARVDCTVVVERAWAAAQAGRTMAALAPKVSSSSPIPQSCPCPL